MSIALPEPVAAYFAAEKRADVDALARCFVDDAIVRDEGRTIEGVAAIKQWNAAAREKYHHTVEPIDAADRDGKTVVIGLHIGMQHPAEAGFRGHKFSLNHRSGTICPGGTAA